MDNLIYETERYLRSVPLLPETRSYKPVGHGTFIDITEDELAKHGLTITGKDYTVTQNGQIATGKYNLMGANVQDKEMGMSFLWQNSVNKAATGKMAGGANVAACDNGCIWGDYTLARKHTGSIEEDIREFARETISKLEENFAQLQHDRDHMKDIVIQEPFAHEFLGRAFLMKNQLLNSEQMSRVRNEMKNSENFPMWQNWLNPDRDNMWNLYNNITEALKSTHASKVIAKHTQLHSMVKEEFGF